MHKAGRGGEGERTGHLGLAGGEDGGVDGREESEGAVARTDKERMLVVVAGSMEVD
jgi:hypothetical protein